MSTHPAVEMRKIVKRFGSVTANDQVDFTAERGEIHALLGENGAGKSTMMCMLSGVYRATEGEIRIQGRPVRIRSPKEAAELGIGMVFQNFRLVQTLTAAENMVLGEKGGFWRGAGWMKRKTKEIAELAERFGLGFPVDRPIWQLSVGEQQRVEIVKTLYRGADIIILDEPTSVLTPGEAEQLFATLRQMRAEGKTILITTHKMKEVMSVADRISVMRKGRMIASLAREETDERQLAQLMVGKEVVLQRKEREPAGMEPLLALRGLKALGHGGRKALDGLDLEVRKGEIVGIAGVAGNGQKELAEVLNGLHPWSGGEIEFDGAVWKRASALEAIESGIAHIPENRMKSGLAGSLAIADNLLSKSYRGPERSRLGLLRGGANRRWAQSLVEQFDVRTPSLDTPVRMLSGGNQQKLLFAREISMRPKLMVAVHPTQGLDVGAADSVHRMLMELRASGSGVLLISEDLDEILQLSDRVLVVFGGRIIGEMAHDEADRQRIGLLMTGSAGAEEAAAGRAGAEEALRQPDQPDPDGKEAIV
ncbi:ABC transporter ATP-binding protein [Paenibacillus pasadenensis]|uniref:ABC transporter ATP-binding protein n=1 Tax=Paenibacillus TaxID=44249 RepID=UPI00040F1F04|nr:MULTISPECIES: ABC transporter ATP-binding protein [Paenibacillus]QGG57720.1 ATP-binding cassette domain-containing protein [Paenibacillus sp. B01]